MKDDNHCEIISSQKRSFLVTSALCILHNCAMATENRQVFRDLRAVERVVPFVKTGKMELVAVAILTLSYITDDEQKDLLEVDSKVRKLKNDLTL